MHYRIIYTGDWHFDKKIEKFRNSYEQLYEYVHKNPPSLLIITGDISDGLINVGPLYNEIVDKIKNLAIWCPIYMIYGTPSHDFKGSLDGFAKLKSEYPIKVIDKASYTYFSGKSFYDSVEDGAWKNRKDAGLVLCGFPYPIRSRFLSDIELQLPFETQNRFYKERLLKWCAQTHQTTEDYNKFLIPTLLVAHLQLEGSIPSFKQDMQAEYQKVEWFDNITNWGCLGHIHNSKLYGTNLQYTGSFYNKTRGETEDKFFYELIIENCFNIKNVAHKLVTPKLLKIDCKNIEDYKKYKEQKWEDLWDLWFIVKASNKQQLDIEKEEQWWKEQSFIDEIKIELDLTKTEATYRTEEFSTSMNLLEKFIVWCGARKKVPSEFQKHKIKELV